MVATYLFWATQSRNIPLLSRAKSHKVSSVAQNRKTPILSRSGRNLPDLGRNGRNIIFLGRTESQYSISGSRKVL